MADEPEPRPFEHEHEIAGRVLVRALGPDRFAILERDVQAGGRDAHVLGPAADQVHLDAGFGRVPDRAVIEGGDVEGPAQLAIDSDQQVAVERRRHAERIVVRHEQIALGLDEIGADQEPVVSGERGTNAAQERVHSGRIEVADVRSEKQGQRAPRAHRGRGFGKTGLVRGLMRHDVHVRERRERPARQRQGAR